MGNPDHSFVPTSLSGYFDLLNSLDQFRTNFGNERLHNWVQGHLFKSHDNKYNPAGNVRLVPQVPYFNNSERARLLQNTPG